jgi:hypothetical protein
MIVGERNHTVASTTSVNVRQAVPFFGVTDMQASLQFYADGLGFRMKHWWIPNREEDKPESRIRWCRLELGEAAIMLQEFLPERQPKESWALGQRSVSCAKTRGQSIASSNHMELRRGNVHSWVTVSG